MSRRQRFGALLRQHRGERKPSEVAEAVGVYTANVLDYEDGHLCPTLPVYIRLCRTYGLTLAQRAELDELAAGMGGVSNA